MSSSVLYRWAGYALIIGAILLVVGEWMHPANAAANVTTGAWATSHDLLLLALLFGIAGLFGLYARQAKETKGLGFIGFLLIFIAMTLLVGIVYFEAFINPVLAKEAPAFVEKVFAGQVGGPVMTVLPLTGFAFSLGWLLFGWATARAGVLPRTAAWLAVVGGFVFGLEPLFESVPYVAKLAALVFGVGTLWLGYALTAEKRMMMA